MIMPNIVKIDRILWARSEESAIFIFSKTLTLPVPPIPPEQFDHLLQAQSGRHMQQFPVHV